MDAVVVRLGAEHEIELGRGVVEISLLDVQQPDLGARVGGIGLDLLGALQLVERLVVFLLPDQDFRFALSHQLVVRVDLRDLVVINQRVLRPFLALAQQREIQQHQLRLRIQIERLLIIFFGGRVILRRPPSPCRRSSSQGTNWDRARSARRRFSPPRLIAALGVERAEIQISFLIFRIEPQYLLVVFFRGRVVAERRADSRAEQACIG